MSTSAVLHGAVIAVAASLAGVTSVVVPRPETDLTFVEVVPPPPVRVPLQMPPVVKQEIRYIEEPKIEPEPEPKPEPEKVVARTEPTPPAPEPPREVIEPPKPKPVTLGSFDPTGNSTRAPEQARPIVAAGFDALAARTPDMKTATAAVGAFELSKGQARPGTDRPNVVGDAGFGVGVSTGRGRGGAGGVVTSGGFDTGKGGGGGRPQGAVKTTDFDAKAPQHVQQAAPQARTEVALEILSKPTPKYTDEARAMKIEGEVLLDVEFAATGEVRVLGVVRGLGHGLDESATRAVQGMRFKAAQRNGQPIDFRTTVHIVFRLA